MDLQAIHDAISQQNLIMQRMERNMRRIEDSYGRVSSRLDALEAKEQTPPPNTGESRRFRRAQASSGADSKDREGSGTNEKPDDKVEDISKDTGEREEKGRALTARVKYAIRSSIQDGSISAALDKFQASVKLTDEATSALSEIASLVKVSLEQDQDVIHVGSSPLPGGSLALLLEMAKTPQFQRFIANVLAQVLKEAEV
jgi:hypothetical protein